MSLEVYESLFYSASISSNRAKPVHPQAPTGHTSPLFNLRDVSRAFGPNVRSILYFLL